jgi:hypothetical protein
MLQSQGALFITGRIKGSHLTENSQHIWRLFR